jgi:dephospho-CoA kinase
MKVCGLTGGVGMGKSTAAHFLRARGLPVVDTDELARQFVEPGQPALAEIQEAFGKNLVASDGRLRRDELARLVFADAGARATLEKILHPKIRARWRAQIKIWRGENCPLAVVIIPLLFETRAESEFTKLVCVACSAANQHRRLLERGWSPQQIQQRIVAQLPVEQKIARADFIVWTDGALDAHEEQIGRIFPRI